MPANAFRNILRPAALGLLVPISVRSDKTQEATPSCQAAKYQESKMFRSSLLFVVAAVISQPLSQTSTADAGGFKPVVPHFGVPHVAVPNIVLPHFNLPGTFVPHVAVPSFTAPNFTRPHFPQPNFPQFNDRRFKHFDTFSKWQSNRRLLGNPVGIETSVFTSRTQGSWMRFEHGYIVRYASGRTFIVRGGIGQAWIDAGGVYGKLGFPKGNEFEFNSQGHDAQVFEHGLIHWNHMLGRFVIGPNKSKV
jgi:hypothetical protein